ncbi:hypothetical protein CEXT_269371, partial [Caerostris extrusa]
METVTFGLRFVTQKQIGHFSCTIAVAMVTVPLGIA